MSRLTPILLTIPIVLSLGMVSPAKAECTRYKVWDSNRDTYIWRQDCYRSDRNYDDSRSYRHRKDRNNQYWLLRNNRDWRNDNAELHDRYRAKMEYQRYLKNKDAQKNGRYNNNDWDDYSNGRYNSNRWDDYSNGRYDSSRWDDQRYGKNGKNPELNIFLGF